MHINEDIITSFLRGNFGVAWKIFQDELSKLGRTIVVCGYDRDLVDFLMIGAMVAFAHRRYIDSLALSTQAREICRANKLEDISINFMIFLVSRIYLDTYYARYSKTLPIYDMELCYTTEDEAVVHRDGRYIGWTGWVTDTLWLAYMGESSDFTEEIITMHPDVTHEKISALMKHKTQIMTLYNDLIFQRIKDTDKILDLGSGHGIISGWLYMNGKRNEISLVDIYEGYVDKSKHHFDKYFPDHNCTFYTEDIMDFNFLKSLGTFDVIIACDLVEHLYKFEFESLLGVVMNMLNGGGRFYIQTPNGLRYLGKVLDDSGEIIIPEFLGTGNQHVSEKTVGYFKKLLDERGWNYNILETRRIVIEIIKG